MSGDGRAQDPHGRTPAAETIRSRRAEGPGLLSRIPGMAYQCRDDPERTMEFVSAGSTALTGLEPHLLVGEDGPSYTSLVHPDDRERVSDAIRDAVRAGEPWDLEYRVRPVRRPSSRDGVKWVWDRGHAILSETGDVLGLEGFVTDVTERRELELSLLTSQKLEALGEITGSIAHDFNNLLTAIITPVELVLDELDADTPLARELAQINETAHYAAGLTRQLLAFCRKQAPVRRVVDVNQVVELLVPTLERIVGDRVRLVVRRGPGPLAARVDPSRLEQVLVNLVVNARDAQPGGGVVTLSTGSARLKGPSARSLGVEPGAYVSVGVSDEGEGIPPDVLRRVFEPFFTTKDEGTGLGLSTVYGIVTQHDGAVDVVSEPGEGSTFQVYLPLLEAPVEDLAAQRPPSARKSGTANVLLVENDDRVRLALAEALRRHGYRVLSAGSAADARARVRDAEPPDVVVSEALLDDALGPDLVAELVGGRDDVRVVYVAGYADEDVWESLDEGGASVVLQKPFTLAQLLEAVGAVG